MSNLHNPQVVRVQSGGLFLTLGGRRSLHPECQLVACNSEAGSITGGAQDRHRVQFTGFGEPYHVPMSIPISPLQAT
jgi:hypothetical protein